MIKIEEFLKCAKINLFLLMISIAFTWSLVFLKPEWMYLWVYYSNVENWLKDSSSYLIVGMSFLIPGMLLLFSQIIRSILTKQFMMFFVLIVILISIFFFFDHLAKKVLFQEIRQINYERYLQNAQNNDLEAHKIAFMLNNDCKITILELNQNMFGIYPYKNIQKEKIKLNKCNNLTQAKSNLINFLQKKQFLQP